MDFGYHFTYKTIDRGLIESLGPFGLSNVLMDQVNKFRSWHSGYLYHCLIALGWSNLLFGLLFVSSFLSLRILVLSVFISLWLIV